MNNNLSKQLCELCGIKPRYGIYVDYGDLDHNYKLVTNERKYRLIADVRWNIAVEDEDLRDLKPEFYPDFMQPENFVRLFNLTLPIRGISTIAEFVTFEYLTITDSKDFLKKLIKAIQEPYAENEVIQSIREAEWVYE